MNTPPAEKRATRPASMTVPAGWAQLIVQRFKCGHEKTPANSYQAGEFARCKACHDAKRKKTNKINGHSAGRPTAGPACAASR